MPYVFNIQLATFNDCLRPLGKLIHSNYQRLEMLHSF